MKAVEINKTGGPEVLEVKDISLDKPGPDQVTIEQKAIGLNYIDTYHRSGLYPLKLPIGLGLEGAGIITDVGENVKDFKVGDKISYAGIPLGSYSSHRNYPTMNLVKVPDGIDLEMLAAERIARQLYRESNGPRIMSKSRKKGNEICDHLIASLRNQPEQANLDL